MDFPSTSALETIRVLRRESIKLVYFSLHTRRMKRSPVTGTTLAGMLTKIA